MPRQDRVPVGEAVLPCGPAAPRAARAVVTEWLSGFVGMHKLDDVRLVVTELVTNSVRHAQLSPGDAVTLRIHLAEHSLRIEVTNPGTAGEIAAGGGSPHAGGGLGLRLVERLCLTWGIARDRDTTVWGEFERAGG
jgi:anti-sigma regulatory factor (Ser/Thr protein kinase)